MDRQTQEIHLQRKSEEIRKEVELWALQGGILNFGEKILIFMHIREEPVVMTSQYRDALSLPIKDLELSTRARKICCRLFRGYVEDWEVELANITIGELVEKTADDILYRKNCGVITLAEIRDKLQAKFGLKLKGD